MKPAPGDDDGLLTTFPPFFFLAAIVTLIVGLSPFPFTAHLCTYICDPLTLFFLLLLFCFG